MKHPMQPVEIGNDKCVRFKQNLIVVHLLEIAAKHGLDLNEIAIREYSDDDRSQLAQLIGYSVSGYGNLSYSRKRHRKDADEISHSMCGCND